MPPHTPPPPPPPPQAAWGPKVARRTLTTHNQHRTFPSQTPAQRVTTAPPAGGSQHHTSTVSPGRRGQPDQANQQGSPPKKSREESIWMGTFFCLHFFLVRAKNLKIK
jgi:hypothetical protein